MAHKKLDELDKKILGLILNDARIPFLEVARVCNVSGAAIHQRIQKLQSAGVLKGTRYIVNAERMGYETCAYVGLYLKNPEKHEKMLSALRKMPEVVECHVTSGAYDILVKIYAYNNNHLMNIIHDKLQPLGLARTETLISFSEVFNRPLSPATLPDDEYDDDDID